MYTWEMSSTTRLHLNKINYHSPPLLPAHPPFTSPHVILVTCSLMPAHGWAWPVETDKWNRTVWDFTEDPYVAYAWDFAMVTSHGPPICSHLLQNGPYFLLISTPIFLIYSRTVVIFCITLTFKFRYSLYKISVV